MKYNINLLPFKIAFLTLVALCFSVAGFSQNSTVMKTKAGYINGLAEENAIVFKGVPYAAPPIGALRFKPPQPVNSWTDTLQCTAFGPMSAQYAASTKTVKGSEDCLRLNVYKPNITTNKKLPVLVWVHGGAMTAGSGMSQNGHAFADKDSIITITINYRLGVFGFLYLGDVDKGYKASGNNGLLDLVMALKWIQDNIDAFGGDPSRVTVMGESAGAKLTSALLVTPEAKGKFSQLVLESGSVQCIRDVATAKAIRQRVLTALNVTNASQLLNMPTEQLIKAQALVCQGAAGTNYFGPVEDGVVINGDAYEVASKKQNRAVKLLIGTNKQESIMFMGMDKRLYHPDSTVLNAWFGDNFPLVLAAYQHAAQKITADSVAINVLTQYMYQMHSYRLADALAKAGNQLWMYRFDYDKDGTGATHAKELPFVWSLHAEPGSDDHQKLAYLMHTNWVSFIKNGSPAKTTGLNWQSYQPGVRNVMLFDADSRPVVLHSVYNNAKYPTAGFILH